MQNINILPKVKALQKGTRRSISPSHVLPTPFYLLKVTNLTLFWFILPGFLLAKISNYVYILYYILYYVYVYMAGCFALALFTS